MKSSNKKTWIALIITIVHFIPIYITMMVAVKGKTDLSSRWALPEVWALDNFSEALVQANLGQALLNSFIITCMCILLITALGAMAAYPLARNRSSLNAVMMLMFLGVLMIPPLTMMVPLIKLMKNIGGISKLWGIILVLTTYKLPLSILLYKNFIETIPLAIDEASSIDGCTKFQTFWYVILPLLKPVTATVIILTGIEVWNDFQFSLYLLHGEKVQSITLAIFTFFGQTSSNLNLAAAAAIMAILPVTVLFLFLQKYFVKGMVDSAIK